MHIRRIEDADREAVAGLLRTRWAGPLIVTRGEAHVASALPGFIAEEGDRLVGVATLSRDGDALQVVSLDAVVGERGIGSALLEAVLAEAKAQGVRRVWLCTTNDNLPALRFWQRRGFRLVALYPGAIERARALKPQIPEVGHLGIPLRDELELEVTLP